MTKMLITPDKATRSSIKTMTAEQINDQYQIQNAMRVPWYAVILCRLGIHWGKWDYVAERNCSQLLVCGRCGATRLRTRHQRQWVYVRNGHCKQVRTCQRCQAESGNRIKHDWSSATFEGITGTHSCYRCGEVETWQNVG